MRRIAETVWILMFVAVLVIGCQPRGREQDVMNPIAEDYVRLVLAVGQHDDGYVDAYYGPGELLEEVEAEAAPLSTLRDRAATLLASLEELETPEPGTLEDLRHQYLHKQLQAVDARIRMLEGEQFGFDSETAALYDAVAPAHEVAYFQAILTEIGAILPGPGPLGERVAAFRERFTIPEDKIPAVFDAAIDECRERTLDHLVLPQEERFSVEYVNDKPWSGYNWYQGGSYSLIQINTDLPILIDRAIDLGCHEGYPGHHTYNALLEKKLVQERGWVEFSVYPLFSPQSLIAEGTANYGIDMAFPDEQRLEFERDVLFPLAGLDPDDAGRYYQVENLLEKLAYADNEAARRYLDGELSRSEAVEWLIRYRLYSQERAEQRVRFIEAYRGYVINYNLGQDMVGRYIEGLAGDDPEARWQEFGRLISSPRLPSGLQ